MQGASDNCPGLANTLQAFMITFVLSSYKDIEALFPVKALTASELSGYCKLV